MSSSLYYNVGYTYEEYSKLGEWKINRVNPRSQWIDKSTAHLRLWLRSESPSRAEWKEKTHNPAAKKTCKISRFSMNSNLGYYTYTLL